MLSNIKAWLSIGIAALLSVLYAGFRIKSAKLDSAEDKVNHLEQVNEQNQQSEKVSDEVEKINDDIDRMSNDGVNSVMHKYDRSRKGKD